MTMTAFMFLLFLSSKHKNNRKALLIPPLLLDLSHHVRKTGSSRRVR